MQEYAYGRMGLSVTEFAEITPFVFDLKYKGFKDLDYTYELRFRKLAYMIYAVNADPKGPKLTLDDVWPMPGRRAKQATTLFSKKQIDKLVADFRKNKQQ